MRKLTNDLSWSVSRAQLFQSCPRAYYYAYYGSWGGWEADASERTRTLYILKNVKPLLMWAGSIVHDIIKDTMEAVARGAAMPNLEELQNQAVLKLRNGWTEAVTKAWLQYPKKTNLFELYYGDGKSLPRETTDKIKERIFTCLDSFVSSPVVRDILATPYINWKPVDTLDTFMVNDLKVWCAIDFAYTDNEGQLHIIDWKTGTENRATLRQQLGCYALFAMEKWLVPLERLQLKGVFLLDGGRPSPYPVEPALLVSVKDQILISAQAMKQKLRDPENNIAEEDDFPCQPNEYNCRQCNYRQVCPQMAGSSNDLPEING